MIKKIKMYKARNKKSDQEETMDHVATILVYGTGESNLCS